MHRITFFKKIITDINGLVAAVLSNYVLGWIDPVGLIVVSDINKSRKFIGIYYFNNRVNMHGVGVST
jgi:hypothetical protein